MGFFKDLTDKAKNTASDLAKKVKKEDVEQISSDCKESLDKGDKKGAATKLAEGVGKIFNKNK